MKKLDNFLRLAYMLFLPFFTIGLLMLGIMNFYFDDDSLATFLFANIGCLLAIIYYSLFVINTIIDVIVSIKTKKKEKKPNKTKKPKSKREIDKLAYKEIERQIVEQCLSGMSQMQVYLKRMPEEKVMVMVHLDKKLNVHIVDLFGGKDFTFKDFNKKWALNKEML